MGIWKIFESFAKEKIDGLFWRSPDTYLAAIILNDTKVQVYGRVKGDLALLEQIPEPQSGYCYKDVVKVMGPIGKQLYRDEEIGVYQVVSLFETSAIPTFLFTAVIPEPRDYFRFLDWFKENGQKAEFPWLTEGRNNEWRSGLCTAANLEHASALLNDFMKKADGRQVKDIHQWDRSKTGNQ